MAKIVNTATVQTTEGPVVLTKTSTHRTYVVASVATYKDGTEALLSWHLTTQAGANYAKSRAAIQTATYNQRHHGGSAFQGIVLREVVVETKAPKAPATHNEAVEAFQAQQDSPAIVLVQSGTTGNTCRCGCGEAIGARSQYRPGHDARHAGIVARDIAASASTQYMERTTADGDLGSEALVAKAHAMADRLIAKQAKKASK